MEPCYKKFTIIISKARNKRKTTNDPGDDDALRKKSRARRTSVGGNLCPDHCYFCKKERKSVKGKVQLSQKLTLKSTEERIKPAAEEKKDENVLRDIRDVDLLAKEFQVHDKCRLDYTRTRDNDEPERSEKPALGSLMLLQTSFKIMY